MGKWHFHISSMLNAGYLQIRSIIEDLWLEESVKKCTHTTYESAFPWMLISHQKVHIFWLDVYLGWALPPVGCYWSLGLGWMNATNLSGIIKFQISKQSKSNQFLVKSNLTNIGTSQLLRGTLLLYGVDQGHLQILDSATPKSSRPGLIREKNWLFWTTFAMDQACWFKCSSTLANLG